MATITTVGLRNAVATNFINDMSSPESNTSLYLTLSRQNPWAAEPTPDLPVDTIQQFTTLWDTLIFGKIITLNNLSLVVNRINWTSNSIYTAYSDKNSNLFNTQFYVMNSNNEVYKCLANNTNAVSLNEPVGFGSIANNYIQTSDDGYQWKYILQVQPADAFLNDFWIPIPTIAPIGSAQNIIYSSAVPGSIDVIQVNDGGSGFTNSPQAYIIDITGDGVDANAYANVSDNQIQNIVMVNRGSGYHRATVTFTDPNGVGANATVILPPPGGHGSDAHFELGATTVMVSVVTSDTEAGFLTVSNEVRQISLLLNPLKFGSTDISSNTRVRAYNTFNVSGGIGTYSADEVVFQGASINTSTFSGLVIDFDPILGILTVNNTQGAPLQNSILYGDSSGAQRYITNIVEPDLEKYTGRYLEIENSPPIERSTLQQEQFQAIISF